MGRTLLTVAASLVACRAPEAAGPISLEEIGTVTGPAEDGGFIGYTMLSAHLGNGERIAYAPWLRETPPPYHVDRGGKTAGVLARIGPGPGEVTRPEYVLIGLGDTIFVIDRNRISVFDPELRFVRSFPFRNSGAQDGVQLLSGTLVLASASVPDPEQVVAIEPLHGETRWVVRTPPMEFHHQFLELASDGSVWGVRRTHDLAFNHYDENGRLIKTIPMPEPWLAPSTRPRGYSRTIPPNARVEGFWVDSLDRAWVVGQVPDPNWASVEVEEQTIEGVRVTVPKRDSDLWDGMIAVIDLATGKTVAELRQDRPFPVVVEPWILARYRSDEDGWGSFTLQRVISRF